MKGFIVGSLITVFTTTQLLAASPVLPPFSGITQSTTHAVTIDNDSDSSFQFTLSPGGAYDILPNYGYQIPVTPNTQFNLAAVKAVQTTSTTTPRVDYAETTEALPYSSAPTTASGSITAGIQETSAANSYSSYVSNVPSGTIVEIDLNPVNDALILSITGQVVCRGTALGAGEGVWSLVLIDLSNRTKVIYLAQGFVVEGEGVSPVSIQAVISAVKLLSTVGYVKGDGIGIQLIVTDLIGTNNYDYSIAAFYTLV